MDIWPIITIQKHTTASGFMIMLHCRVGQKHITKYLENNNSSQTIQENPTPIKQDSTWHAFKQVKQFFFLEANNL